MAYVLFDEKLDALSIAGMVICAAGVVIVNRGGRVTPGAGNAAASIAREA
jgi:drug/metabolite transporter (DMT)-like permease